jgi:prepilin-type N-terminal cleavage/methylation domain-containing protein
MIRKLRHSNGFTLLELLAAIIISVLLLSVAYPVLLFGIKSYHDGQAKSSLQDQVQMASLTITKKLRYAQEVSISAETVCPSTLQSGYNYICVDSAGHSIKNASTLGTGNIINDASGKQSYAIVFSANGKLLNFDITGSNTESTYHIQTEISIMNASTSISAAGAIPYKVLKYK